MAGTYQDLMGRARQAYQMANNGFHPDSAAQAITEALDGFDRPLAEIGAIIATSQSAGSSGATPATRDGLRMLDAQLTVLQAAIDAAARADRNKVARAALLDQARFVQNAKVQQAADRQLLDGVAKLIETVRADAASDAEGGDGGSTDGLKPVDVAALEGSLRARASPQDQFAGTELEEIGGQRNEADGDLLPPVDLEALKESLRARASPQDAFASEELTQISGQLSPGNA